MNSALHVAVENRHLEISEMLIKRGANVNALGDSSTPLQTALNSLSCPLSFELVAMLISNGADPNTAKPGSNTPLHAAIGEMQFQPLPQTELVELLLQAGADATARTSYGETPLEFLLKIDKLSGRAALVKMLVQAEARSGRRPDSPILCVAASRDEPQVLRILIEAGMDVNHGDEAGSPLHHAARHGLNQNVELLLAAGADPCALDSAGRRPIECIPQKLLDALNILEQHAARI